MDLVTVYKEISVWFSVTVFLFLINTWFYFMILVGDGSSRGLKMLYSEVKVIISSEKWFVCYY